MSIYFIEKANMMQIDNQTCDHYKQSKCTNSPRDGYSQR